MYFLTFHEYLKKKHGFRIWRLPLSTGNPCPNRLNGKSGCTFCNETSFVPHYLRGEKDTLKNQIIRGMKFFAKRYKVDYFYGYFQHNTSTYGDIDNLCNQFEYVLSNDKMLGLIISTRPDYINKKIIDSIVAVSNKHKNKDIWIELGLQSTNDKTLRRINRNHTYKDFREAVKIIKENSRFQICVHMIIGLPGENKKDIIDEMRQLFSQNKIDGIKFRLLEIFENTPMKLDYEKHKSDFTHINVDDYVDIIYNSLLYVPKNVVVMRFVNYKSIEILCKSGKKLAKHEIVALIAKKFEENGTYQGIYNKCKFN